MDPLDICLFARLTGAVAGHYSEVMNTFYLTKFAISLWKSSLSWSRRFGIASAIEMPCQVRQTLRRRSSTGGLPTMLRIRKM